MAILSLNKKSATTLVILAAVYLLIKIYFLVFPVKFAVAGQEMVFGWGMIAATILLGFLGYVCTKKTGFTDLWDDNISNFKRFIIPALLGLLYGVITILPIIIQKGGRSHPLVLGNTVHVALPAGIPFYVYGAIFMEVFLKLGCIGILTWLLTRLDFKKKYTVHIFWIVNIVVAFYEPMPFIQQDISNGRSPIMAIGSAMLGALYISNVVSGYIGMRYGFLASLTMRLAHYAVWHIIWGNIMSSS